VGRWQERPIFLWSLENAKGTSSGSVEEGVRSVNVGGALRAARSAHLSRANPLPGEAEGVAFGVGPAGWATPPLHPYGGGD